LLTEVLPLQVYTSEKEIAAGEPQRQQRRASAPENIGMSHTLVNTAAFEARERNTCGPRPFVVVWKWKDTAYFVAVGRAVQAVRSVEEVRGHIA
jgi:hypothetical protein